MEAIYSIYNWRNKISTEKEKDFDEISSTRFYWQLQSSHHQFLKVGDFVRVADKRDVLSERSTKNWNKELFGSKEGKIHPTCYQQNRRGKEPKNHRKFCQQEPLKCTFDSACKSEVPENENIFFLKIENIMFSRCFIHDFFSAFE